MTNLQIRNMPEDLHQRLRDHASAQRRTMSEIAVQAIERELARESWRTHLATRSPVNLGVNAGTLLEETRRQRDSDL